MGKYDRLYSLQNKAGFDINTANYIDRMYTIEGPSTTHIIEGDRNLFIILARRSVTMDSYTLACEQPPYNKWRSNSELLAEQNQNGELDGFKLTNVIPTRCDFEEVPMPWFYLIYEKSLDTIENQLTYLNLIEA